MAGTLIKVTALISVATIEPEMAHQGSLWPPRKSSRIVLCRPESRAPSRVVSSR